MIAQPPALRIDPETHAIRWTRAGFARLTQSDLLEGEGYELVDGEILRKMKNPPHILAFALALQRLGALFGALYCQPEGPIEVAPEDAETSLPEPDIVVLARPLNARRPTPGEIRLAVEIADTTLGRDLGRKAAIYARAGIPEYWVLDLENRRLHVHRSPAPDGSWASIVLVPETGAIAPLASPIQAIQVMDLLPPSGQPGDGE